MKITVQKNGQKKTPWRQRVSLRWALVLTTVLCALGAFLLIALESWGLEWARDALYLKYWHGAGRGCSVWGIPFFMALSFLMERVP